MAVINKTLIILIAVFSASYVWFSFDFVKSEINRLTAESDDSKIENYGEITYAFPLSKMLSNDRRAETNSVSKEQMPSQSPMRTIPVRYTYNLSIPSLGINAPIVLEPTTNEDRIYKQLEKGVVHYADTPLPGEFGTSIIIGHSSVYPWYKGSYGYVFSNLSNLAAGNLINVEKEGEVYRYQVTRSIIFSPDSENSYELNELENTNGKSIVLMTCWPTGTNAKRIAVRADLI